MFSKTESFKNYRDYNISNGMVENWPNNTALFLDLEKNSGVISEFLRDSNNILKGIYCQDSFMKDVFNFYPDRICLDVTHKFFEIDIFMYVFLCEDSNGRNEVMSIGFSTSDDSEFFLWLLNTFKKHNPNWRKIKIIALDPEIKNKDIARNVFPTPYIIICFHHAIRSFRKGLEIIKIQNALSSEQIQYAIELFKNMYNAHSQAEYELYFQQFLVLHSSIVLYFQEVWLSSQHLWRTGLDFFHENIFSSLNCHLENLDFTIKSIFISEGLLKFIKKFFVILTLKRVENGNVILFPNPSMYSRFSTEYHISKTLTPYASKFVIDQYGLSTEIHMDCSIPSDSYYFDNLGSPVNASVCLCQCQFFLYTFLPCRHIFAVRKTLSLSSFDETLIEYSWTRKYYQSTLSSLQATISSLNTLVLNECVPKCMFISNLLEKSLPPLFGSLQMSESRNNLLIQLNDLWKNNKDVYLQFDGEDHETILPEANCSSLMSIGKSQFCKIEADMAVDEPTDSLQIDKSDFINRKLPVQSKLFKREYASPTYKHNSFIDNPTSISSPAPNEVSLRQSRWNFKSKILDGCHVNYTYLCRIICDSKETCIDWLRQMELICTSMLCPTCGYGMTMKLVPRLSDGAVWVCCNEMEIKKSCSRRCSVRRGSWFELTNMSFEQILTFCYMWVNGFNQSQIISETGISTATYISWNKLNRRVCEECLMEDSKYSYISKVDSNGYAQVLETWLQKCGTEDSFLKFLQDANAMHRKDSVKHSMG